jgi:methyl-accepting chemotaxis protein PixJ
MTQQSAGRDQRNSKGVPASNFANNQTVEPVIAPLSETPKTQIAPLLPSPEEQIDSMNSPTFSEEKSSRWWGDRRLRFKVMTLAVALATLPVVGIGAAAYYFTNETFTQQVIAERKGYSLSVQSKISLFLRRRVGDIRVMSQLSIFNDPRQRAGLNTQQKQESLNRFVEAYEVYDNIAVIDLKAILRTDLGRGR